MAGSDYTLAAPLCACGNTITKFFKSGKPGKFCAACRERQMGKHLGDRLRPCAHCGTDILLVIAAGPPKRYCSDLCKSRANGKEWVPAGEREFVCACCSASFKAERARKYCSASCNWRAQTLKRYPDSKKRHGSECVCRGCGKQYKNKRHNTDGQGSKYCSRQCAFADIKTWHREDCDSPGPTCTVHFKTCAHCAVSFTARNINTPVCSDACRKALANTKGLARNIAKCGSKMPRVCKCCSATFAPTYGDKRNLYCSDACAKRVARRVRGSDHRDRAKKAGVAYEPVNRIKVFDRDGWRCQICGKRTPRKRMGGQTTNAPELDHRVPLSKGGGHLYSNVQCACRQCNHEKGNRNSAGQLPMFGA